MTTPWMPDSRPYAADTIARQQAQKAKDAAVAVMPVVGQATVPALALGGTAQVVVALPQEIPGAAYEPIPYLLSASTSLLGGLQIGGVVSKTATAVTVLVRAPLVAVAAGAILRVVAFRTS